MSTRASRKEAPSQTRMAQREDTRRRLLACARALFRAQGVEPVSMEDIAQAAKVSRATVYLHFAGKPVLLEALLEEDWSGQLQLFERLRKVDFTSADSITQWVRRVLSGMKQASDSFAIHRAALGQSDRLMMAHQQHIAALAEALCHASGAGEARVTVLDATLIVAEIEHFATASVVMWSDADTEVAVRLVVERLRAFAAKA